MGHRIFDVYEYSIERLVEALCGAAPVSKEIVRLKLHSTYFEDYLVALNARTFVVEHRYIDHDYLEDYASYYVRCFTPPERVCVRIHFFGNQFDSEGLEKHLRRSQADPFLGDLQANYLGFMVVKPLPRTLIGRTCLKTYDLDGGRRCYPISRRYEANLFGLSLTVESIAFQEQDSVVAACATSALWAAFQGTGKLFQHAIPSPSEITRLATAGALAETRAFPSKGLTLEQMANAIRSVGLEPEYVGGADDTVVRAVAYGYLNAGIPVVLGGELVDTLSRPPRAIGHHAITVTGYSLLGPEVAGLPETAFRDRCLRIDKLYAHDDGVGPFARVQLDCARVVLDDSKERFALSTSWIWEDVTDPYAGLIKFLPSVMLLPLYPKIRISLASVRGEVQGVDEGLLDLLRREGKLPLNDRIEWGITLTTVNSYKTSASVENGMLESVRYGTLTEPMPRFMWLARATSGGSTLFDLLYDATDIEQASFFIRVVPYENDICKALAELAMKGKIDGLPEAAQQALKGFASREAR